MSPSTINRKTMNHRKKSSRPPNLKEFVRYLNKTIDMFDHHIPDSEFENTESKVHQLFYSLFNIYLENHPITLESEGYREARPVKYPSLPEIETMIHQHYDSKKIKPVVQSKVPERKSSILQALPENVEDSDAIARRIYRQSLADSGSSDEKPYEPSRSGLKERAGDPVMMIEKPTVTHRPSQKPSKKRDSDSFDRDSHDDLSEVITHVQPVKKTRSRSRSFKDIPSRYRTPSKLLGEEISPVRGLGRARQRENSSFEVDDLFSSPSPPPKTRPKRKSLPASPEAQDEDTEILDKRIAGLRKMLRDFD